MILSGLSLSEALSENESAEQSAQHTADIEDADDSQILAGMAVLTKKDKESDTGVGAKTCQQGAGGQHTFRIEFCQEDGSTATGDQTYQSGHQLPDNGNVRKQVTEHIFTTQGKDEIEGKRDDENKK